jgi:hypothetical protein
MHTSSHILSCLDSIEDGVNCDREATILGLGGIDISQVIEFINEIIFGFDNMM